MIYSSNGNIAPIVIGVVLGVVVLIGIIVILYHFVISRSAFKKQVKDLEKDFSYVDALLVGQDAQFIHRLELISRTNLLYLDKHDSFSRRYKEIFEGEDKYTDSLIRRCNSLLANKQYKHLKSAIDDAKASMASFDKKVHELDNDLFDIIKPEDEARASIQRLKESFRLVKQSYYQYSGDLELVSSTFARAFEKLDRTFADFENHLESAEYEEANELIPIIDNVIKSLDSCIRVLPNLCILITSVVPQQISELKEEFRVYESKGLPLFNLSFKTKTDNWYSAIADIKNCLIAFKTKDIDARIAQIQDEIANVHKKLQEELDDRDYFESHMNGGYSKIIELEKEFIRINAILPKIAEIYDIDQAHQDEFEGLKKCINNASASKRILENFVHSSTKQPYSILKNKLDELDADYEKAFTGLNEFKAYLNALKTSSEEAYSLVFIYYYRIKQTEASLREIGIDSFASKYDYSIEESYNYLNEIDELVKTQPIDIDKINEKVAALKKVANNLFEDIETKLRESQLAETAIIYTNRDRLQQSDVHQQLAFLEKDFYNGDFARVYHEANELYKRMHVEDKNSNNGR